VCSLCVPYETVADTVPTEECVECVPYVFLTKQWQTRCRPRSVSSVFLMCSLRNGEPKPLRNL
jgi:hypothetical protein